MLVYHDLEILNIDYNPLYVASSIIENSEGHLKKISQCYDSDIEDNFDEDSLIFIRKIYEHCPLIEYLSLAFPPSKEHFTEFEKLLRICQNLRSLLLLVNVKVENYNYEKMIVENGEELLKILIKSAPTNLREIRFFINSFKFSLETLEEFLGKWIGQPLSILTTDPIYEGDDYIKLINKYKNDGVIKDFRCGPGTNLYYEL